jgi:hypothetical protein
MTHTQKHHISQLHKAVEMSRLDPAKLNLIELQRLRLDLYEFQSIVGMGTHYLQAHDDPLEGGVPERFVKDMVEGLRDTFIRLAEGRYPVSFDMKANDVHFRVYLQDASMPFFLGVNMELGRSSAIYALLRHFEGSGLSAGRVRRCPREGCGNLFVLGSHERMDRMRYCSVRCSRMAATRAYHQRQAKKKTGKRRRSRWETVMGAKRRRSK